MLNESAGLLLRRERLGQDDIVGVHHLMVHYANEGLRKFRFILGQVLIILSIKVNFKILNALLLLLNFIDLSNSYDTAQVRMLVLW